MGWIRIDGVLVSVTDDSKYAVRHHENFSEEALDYEDFYGMRLVEGGIVPEIVPILASPTEEHKIQAEANYIARFPMLLDRIPALAAWDAPETIIAVCEARLTDAPEAEKLRLRGAIRYAERRIEEEQASAREHEHA